MTASQLVFYCLATLLLVGAVLAVTSRKIFRSAIWLLFSLLCIAGLYFWMELPFIAAVQIIVYVGGIVVLIIFSIFLTQQSGADMLLPVRSRQLFSLLAVITGFAFCASLLYRTEWLPAGNSALNTDVSVIGEQMLSTTHYGYVLPFEAVSMLLLAAMVGCIVIAMKTKPVKENSAST
ncbi:MAG TPA: NADH-quinone oxidoreductase subunit J [Chitinophagaceae bacterium]|nr:NADH-quinone oxidoreductase subunit J [Chitinophagaceae bacterium]